MDPVNNPIDFVNTLLTLYHPDTLHQSFQVCSSINMQLGYLNLNLDKLRYAVLARQYEDSLALSKDCHRQFNQFQSEIKRDYIQTLYDKYVQVLEILKNQLLEDFQPNDIIISLNLERAGEMLSLLTEHERIKFLQSLCDKICTNMPDGPFHKQYRQQLIWIYPLLQPESKYRILDQWEFNRFIIDAWANKIRDSIIEENLDKITLKIFKSVTRFEQTMKRYHPNPDGLLIVVFDPFCNHQIQTMIDNYGRFNQTNSFSLSNFTVNVYDGVNQRFHFLAKIETHCRSNFLINSRNESILSRFISSAVLEIISTLDRLIAEDYLKDRSHLVLIRSTLDYIKQNGVLMEERMKIPLSVFEVAIHTINIRLYKYYKSVAKSYLEISTRSYRNGILNTIRSSISSLDELSSAPIDEIINILKDITNYDANLRTYLLMDIKRYYEDLIDAPSLNNGEIKTNIFEPMLMDLCSIRDSIRDTSAIFTDLENRIKFLNGSILDDNIFVEQYKIFYPNHSLEMLKAILKFKAIRSTNILRLYST